VIREPWFLSWLQQGRRPAASAVAAVQCKGYAYVLSQSYGDPHASGTVMNGSHLPGAALRRVYWSVRLLWDEEALVHVVLHAPIILGRAFQPEALALHTTARAAREQA
jgi:hypothetical protein